MHWIYPSLGSGFFAFGFGAISDSTFTLVIDAYPNVSGGPSLFINWHMMEQTYICTDA